MCGRFTSTSTLEQLADIYDVDEVLAVAEPPRYNVAPTVSVPAIATRRRDLSTGRPASRLLGSYRWGLVPSWAKDLSIGSRLINARAEGIATKPAFKRALVRRRCVIPADAYYEWQVRPGDGTTAKAAKLPWAIRRVDGEPMAFAGLWEGWRDPADPQADWLRTATIVTTGANGRLAPVHDRMPVVLDRPGWDTWLDPDVTDVEVLTGLLVPAPADWFDTWPVSSRVNKATEDGPELLDPLPVPPGVQISG